jgi:hypothetical protein
MTWKNKTLLIGVILGALSGLGAAMLYIRTVEESGTATPKKVNTGDALKVTISAFNLIKQVSNLAD